MPFTTSFSVPSPPNATTRSKPSPTASRVERRRMVAGLGLDRLDVVAAAQRVHDQVLEARRHGRRPGIDDQQHARLRAGKAPCLLGRRNARLGRLDDRRLAHEQGWTQACCWSYPGGEGRNDTRRSGGRLEPRHAVPLLLAHAAVVQQQVHVPEHLGKRQVCLRDRDVAEQRLGQVVAGARPLGDQLVDAVGAAARGTRSARRSARRGR